MKKMLAILSMGAMLAATVAAQGYGQPVREVEKESRSGISGYCAISWTVRNDSACNLGNVPSGKILGVRHVSVYCDGPAGEKFTKATLSSTAGNQGMFVPLVTADAMIGRTARAGSSSAFLNVPPGNSLLFTVNLAEGPVPGPAVQRYCQVHYQGFLIDVQPAP